MKPITLTATAFSLLLGLVAISACGQSAAPMLTPTSPISPTSTIPFQTGTPMTTSTPDVEVINQAKGSMTVTLTIPGSPFSLFSVSSVAFSPDNALLASADSDGPVRLWDTESGKLARTLTGHKDQAYSLAFSPDGKWLASGGRDQMVYIWEVATGKEVAKLAGHKAAIHALAFSPAGDILATGGNDNTVRFWSTRDQTQRALWEIHPYPSPHYEEGVWSLAWSPDGTRIVAGSSGFKNPVRIWDTGAERESATLVSEEYLWSRGDTVPGPFKVDWSRDGSLIVAANEDGTYLFDAASGKRGRHLDDVPIAAIAMSPDNQTLASADIWGEVTLWNTATGATLTRNPRQPTITALEFDHTGHSMATAHKDGSIRLWSIP